MLRQGKAPHLVDMGSGRYSAFLGVRVPESLGSVLVVPHHRLLPLSLLCEFSRTRRQMALM